MDDKFRICPLPACNGLVTAVRSEADSGLIERKCGACGATFVLQRRVTEELILIRPER